MKKKANTKVLGIISSLMMTFFSCSSYAGPLANSPNGIAPRFPKGARFLEHHNPFSEIKITIGLKLRNSQKLESFLRQVQDPASVHYHKFLTPSEFTNQFGPTRNQVEQVVKFLNRSGIFVKSTSSNHLLIQASGTTSNVERALNISVNDYTLNGRVFFDSPDRPSLPSSISGYISSVIGISNAYEMTPRLRSPDANIPSRRQHRYHSGPSGYSPQQIADAYN